MSLLAKDQVSQSRVAQLSQCRSIAIMMAELNSPERVHREPSAMAREAVAVDALDVAAQQVPSSRLNEQSFAFLPLAG
jgi:hypothetical protein